jgi:flavodoxin
MLGSAIVYDSHYGNTEKIARAIAAGLGESGDVELIPAYVALTHPPAWPELIVIGGPTQRHGMSPTLRAFIDSLPGDSLRDHRAALFDTRYRMAALLSGSAAGQTASRLRRAGCKLVGPPKSFFVERDRPPGDEKRRHGLERLELGEIERATEWGRLLGAAAVPA